MTSMRPGLGREPENAINKLNHDNRTACENSSLLGGVGGALRMASDVDERMVVMAARTRICNIGIVQRLSTPISRVETLTEWRVL